VAEGDQVASLATGGDPTSGAGAATDNRQTPTEVVPWVKELEGFDEQTRSKLSRFKSSKDVAKSYLELEKRLGASVVIPGKDASQSEKDDFAKRLGRPESPDGYELDQVYLPEGVSRQKDGEEAFKRMAFELGLTKEQGGKLYKYANTQAFEGVAALRKAQDQKRREAAEGLKKEWGAEYDANLAKVQKINKLFGDDNWVQYLNEGAGNEPRLIKVLVKIAKQFSEDTLESGRLPSRTPEKKEPGLLDYGNLRPEITGDNRYRKLTS
jgi:hypothetical protein